MMTACQPYGHTYIRQASLNLFVLSVLALSPLDMPLVSSVTVQGRDVSPFEPGLCMTLPYVDYCGCVNPSVLS